MPQLGRPPKQSVTQRIQNTLGAAQEEIETKDIQKILVPEVLAPIVHEEQPKIVKDAEDDYEFVRNNLHELLVKGNEILEGITGLARDSEKPRTYEVAGGVLKVLIEGTRELMALQKDIRDLDKKMVKADDKKVNVEHAEVTNIVVETTTMDMLDIIEEARNRRQKQIEGN